MVYGYIQDNHVVATVTFIISFIGLLANLLVTTTTLRIPSMRNSFGRLLSSQSAAEAVLCSVFAFFYSPMVFFDIELLKTTSKRAGIVLVICYDVCIFSRLLIALNRMCAICLPLRYKRYFNIKTARSLIVITWVLPVVYLSILHGYYDCDLVYGGKFWTFVYTETDVCKFVSLHFNYWKYMSVAIVIATMDFITITRVHITNLKMRIVRQVQLNETRNREIIFLKQVILQGIVFAVELCTYFLLPGQISNKWVIFLLTTVAWNLCHCVDALIIIGFNAEFRRILSSPRRIFGMKSFAKPSNTLYHHTAARRSNPSRNRTE